VIKGLLAKVSCGRSRLKQRTHMKEKATRRKGRVQIAIKDRNEEVGWDVRAWKDGCVKGVGNL